MAATRSDPMPSAQAGGPAPAPARTYLQLLLLVLIWAVNFSVIKIALAQLAPMAFNPPRFLLASAIVFVVLRRHGPIPLPRPGDRLRILGLGVLGNVIYQLLFIHGIDRTRAGNASLLLAGTPIVTALLSAALGHERVRPRIWLGVVLTVAGMALVVLAGHSEVGLGADTVRGDLTLICASVAWSIYTVGAREPIARYGSVAVTAWTMWVGTVGLLLLGLPDLLRAPWTELSATGWLSIAYSGMFGIGFAYLIWYHGVRRLGNTRTASYSNLVPVVAILVAWATLGEIPTGGQVAGAAVIIGGVTLANARGRQIAGAPRSSNPDR